MTDDRPRPPSRPDGTPRPGGTPRPAAAGPADGPAPDEFAWLYGEGPQPRPELRRRPAGATRLPPPAAARPQIPRLAPDLGPYGRRPPAGAPGQAAPRQAAAGRPAPGQPAPGRPAPGRTAVLPAVAPAPPTRPTPTGPPPHGRPPAGAPPAGARPVRRRRRHPVRRVLIGLLVVVLVLVGGAVGLGEYAWGRVGRIQAFPEARIAAGAGTRYLLIGSDSRAGLTRAQRDALGTGSDAGARTDSIMIVDVPSDGSKPAIISIPRDSYVAIPGYGHDKINAAFAFGGAPLLVRTIEADTGLHIDHVVEIGFGGFAGLVDDLDGVRICTKTAVDDTDAHIDIKAGCQVMTGKTALGYVRARHFDPLGDLGRVQRQRQVLAAIVAKATSATTLAHPGRLWSLASDGGANIAVDDQMHSWNALALARAVRQVSSGNGVTTTVPIANPNATTSAGSSVLWADGQASTLFRALEAGHGVPAALISGSGLGDTS